MSELATDVLDALEAIAPLRLAEPWDNVGLLVDPQGASSFERAFLTVDLTAETLQEASSQAADLVVAYHPPIFGGLKRLRSRWPRESLVMELIRQGITVYSPHTALDSVPGGMNDWLASALGAGEVRPILPAPGDMTAGAGRHVQLDQSVALSEALERIRKHLGLRHLRMAGGADMDKTIRSFGVCPGAGGSVFEKLPRVDLLLTGEMRHHDVLGRLADGSVVVLTDHTNTERGYLPVLAADLRKRCPGLDVVISEQDADPLRVI